jgi:hypothetical protein
MAQLASLLRTRTTAVWLLLTVATLVSWRVGTAHGAGSNDGHDLASVAIVLVAFVKVRLVGLHFMELRGAPRALRGLFEAYCLVVCALVLAMYLAA